MKKNKEVSNNASQVLELKKKMVMMKLQASVSGLEKPHQLKEVKKEIARLKSGLKNK